MELLNQSQNVLKTAEVQLQCLQLEDAAKIVQMVNANVIVILRHLHMAYARLEILINMIYTDLKQVNRPTQMFILMCVCANLYGSVYEMFRLRIIK